jgi:hypothetical protein
VSRLSVVLASALLAVAAVVGLPGSPAGSATSCVAWASLPRQVTLSASRATTIRTTLQASPACTGVTFDNGATAVLRGPGSSPNAALALRWSHIGATYSVTLYGGINPAGTYRIAGGNLQTYDRYSLHIPFTWHTTSVSVTG